MVHHFCKFFKRVLTPETVKKCKLEEGEITGLCGSFCGNSTKEGSGKCY